MNFQKKVTEVSIAANMKRKLLLLLTIIISIIFVTFFSSRGVLGIYLGVIIMLFIYGILLIMGFYLYIKAKLHFLLLLSALNICTIFISIPLGLYVANEEDKNLTNNANVIINKIEEYRMDNGNYPDSLDDLIPLYFNDDIIFNKISYVLFDNNYMLELNIYCGKIYNRQEEDWYYRPCP